MSRVYNFSAGPATLPEAVLTQVQQDMLDWQGSGMSVMEMSHRGKAFVSIAEQAEANLRELLAIPSNYKVLFLQGGAAGQFAGIPLNLLGDKQAADYVVTGSWGKKAVKEGAKFCDAKVVAQPQGAFTSIPDPASWQTRADAAYLHYTPNETIEGVEYHWIPDSGDVPLVADFSSTFLSRPLDVSKFGLIYAGAQKNVGPAGMVIVIVREDLLDRASAQCPMVLNYAQQAEADSMLNTPPCFTWYVAGEVFKWIKQQGGLEAMAEINERKAARLYATIDELDFYANPVDPVSRSWMNVPFTLADAALDGEFLKQAEAAGLSTLKGHRSVGGMRASIYNAMPESGVDALIEFMLDFARRQG
ncbi:MAG: 3-phosphoserine/phosphohydroxythreonine transaminase [Oceanococcus sp.]|nr:MAG: 3-phosphoserine/phosphohydroxythreonine transaminase [Oceanococcus sp.]